MLRYALLGAATLVALAGVARLKGRALGSLPAAAGPGLLVVALGLVAGGIFLPQALRPASSATLAFASPTDGEVVTGDQLDVRFDLQGGRVVPGSSTNLQPDTGHIHVSLDGKLLSMVYGVEQSVSLKDLGPGVHTLLGEFVAADHYPFKPRVTTTVTFRIGG